MEINLHKFSCGNNIFYKFCLFFQRMSCEVETNIERLIQLVEERNCIWDISSENYKDKNLKKEAWREICEELIIGFNDLDNKEMIEKCK